MNEVPPRCRCRAFTAANVISIFLVWLFSVVLDNQICPPGAQAASIAAADASVKSTVVITGGSGSGSGGSGGGGGGVVVNVTTSVSWASRVKAAEEALEKMPHVRWPLVDPNRVLIVMNAFDENRDRELSFVEYNEMQKKVPLATTVQWETYVCGEDWG